MVTDEKNHTNVTEVLEKGINTKVVVVMEEENLRKWRCWRRGTKEMRW